MNTRRFFAYCTLAAWIALTPVAIKTALDWMGAETTIQIGFQQAKVSDGFDDRMVGAFRTAQIKQLEFWWEGGVWAGLTLIGSALLAEPRRKPTQEHAATPEHPPVARTVEL